MTSAEKKELNGSENTFFAINNNNNNNKPVFDMTSVCCFTNKQTFDNRSGFRTEVFSQVAPSWQRCANQCWRSASCFCSNHIPVVMRPGWSQSQARNRERTKLQASACHKSVRLFAFCFQGTKFLCAAGNKNDRRTSSPQLCR